MGAASSSPPPTPIAEVKLASKSSNDNLESNIVVIPVDASKQAELAFNC